MYVNVAVLKETQPHERRVALVPSVVGKMTKLGAKLHMQSGAGDAVGLVDAAFKDVAFASDRHALVRDADVVLGVQAPSLDVINAMKEGAILISFIYAGKEPKLVKRLLDKKITCFAMERIPRITRAQAMDALSSQSALAGYYAVQLGATHLARVLPKITSAAGAIGPAKVLVMGLGVEGPWFAPLDDDGADWAAVRSEHRYGEQASPVPRDRHVVLILRVLQHVPNLGCGAIEDRPPGCLRPTRTHRVRAPQHLEHIRGHVVCRQMEPLTVEAMQDTKPRPAQLHGSSDDGIEHRLGVRRRAANDAEDVGGRCLSLQRFAQLASERRDLFFQNGNRSVIRRSAARLL
jgi:hypothetical protein